MHAVLYYCKCDHEVYTFIKKLPYAYQNLWVVAYESLKPKEKTSYYFP